MMVPKGLRHSQRTENDVKVAKQNAPLMFEALAREIGPHPFAMAHHGAARELGNRALIVGWDFLDRGSNFLKSVVPAVVWI